MSKNSQKGNTLSQLALSSPNGSKGNILILVLVGVLLLGAVSAGVYYFGRQSTKPTQTMADDYRELIQRCGDIPSDETLQLQRGPFVSVSQIWWSPDCKHIAWSVFNSGAVDTITGESVSGEADEGVFIYSVGTKSVEELSLPKPYSSSPGFVKWKNNNELVFSYSSGTPQGRKDAVFDLTTREVLPE